MHAKLKKFIGESYLSAFASIIVVGSIAFVSFDANAVKAKPGLVDYTLPDGKTVSVKLTGDERCHMISSPDGYLLLENEDGFLEYAVKDISGSPVLSGVKVKDHGPLTMDAGKPFYMAQDFLPYLEQQAAKTTRGSVKAVRQKASAGENKYVYSTCAFPTHGEPHSIVVLVEYSNVSFSMDDPWEYFNDFLNGDNFSGNGATGSCRQYFIDSSMGLFKPTYDLYGPVKLSNTQSYYGVNGRYGQGGDVNAHEMIIEAVNALDPIVNFADYDHNGDGYVDSIYVIYAGLGEADGGSANTVWPHSWELSEAAGYAVSVDGVKVDTYGCSNELSGRKPVGIGTFVHEFGHVMGLPDLYNTSPSYYYDSSTPLDWSLMDSGSYNNDSRTPPYFSSFERYSLGWIEPEEILCSGNYELSNLGDTGQAFIMTTEENEDEFFIIENRQLSGWDKYIPFHGMLVWHIDFNQKAWDQNTPNNNPNHQYICLVRADNRPTDVTFANDPFPGMSGNYTAFTSTTNPKLISWNKNLLNVTAIEDISEQGKKILFTATATEDRSDQKTGSVDIVGGGGMDVWTQSSYIHTSLNLCPVFDISGRRVGYASSDNPLQVAPGIYIAAGKKFMVR